MENNNNLAFVAQEWLEPIANCPAECRNRVILAIVEYQLTGTAPDLGDGVAAIAFSYIKPNVDRMAQFRRQQSDRRKAPSASSKSSRRAPEVTAAEPELTETDRSETENDQYSKSKSESKSKSKSESKNNQESDARKAPFPPSVLDIENFCRAQGITNVVPQLFFDYYNPRGWYTAQGNPVRDWQAQVVTWSKRQSAGKAPETGNLAPVPVVVVQSAEELAQLEAADRRERLKRKAEMDYYVSTVPGANTSASVITYPEFCAMGLHDRTPAEIATVIENVRRGLIPRNPIFAKGA